MPNAGKNSRCAWPKSPVGAALRLCYILFMAAVLEKQAKRWTYEEYYRLDDDQRYEIIAGKLLMAPAPDTWHQDWSRELSMLIVPHVKRQKLGKVFIAPIDVVLDEENTVQPDLVFVATANLGIIQRRAIFGTPDLVVERSPLPACAATATRRRTSMPASA